MKKPKQTEMKTSKAERRRNFNPRKWAAKHLTDGGGLPIRIAGGIGESKPPKVMSNVDRRNLGVEQDPALDDFISEEKK